MSNLAQELATEYVRIHNDASPKYSAAFKRIGARMWHDDDAHPLKANNTAFIAKAMQGYIDRGHTEYITEVYGTIARPLTVMDSYPQCHARRSELEEEVYAIYKSANREWREFLAEKGIKW